MFQLLQIQSRQQAVNELAHKNPTTHIVLTVRFVDRIINMFPAD